MKQRDKNVEKYSIEDMDALINQIRSLQNPPMNDEELSVFLKYSKGKIRESRSRNDISPAMMIRMQAALQTLQNANQKNTPARPAEDVDFRQKYINSVEQQILWLQSMVEKGIDEIKASLETTLTNQDAGLGWIEELLRRDVKREAKGNQKKEEQILREIVKQTGLQLGLRTKKDIHDGADKQSIR